MREKVLHERASYLRDSVFAASDGIITTFAVVAGSTGASLGASIVIVLGFANLFADGFSMASGTYLGVKSEMEFEKSQGDLHIQEASPLKQAFVTFLSFDLAGLLPLIPYLFPISNRFLLSILIVFVSMFLMGVVRGNFTKKNWAKSGIEMLFIGGFAALVAFVVGFLVDRFVI
ncbi:hypothetical protein A2962_05340 [Candidatus Woesebacteria bacterium RIFCSPLOWO2_01_FULL_39_61]|uniref:VIT family protein n=1 Tax=Candidatus Woesebacteria bacterium RIFCSPHIGHO2_02_FULL_39_13 TaxID=1802505 RepID=A0A1F7Z387_9BACT|nr:MAG: hypothetical protein A2692_05685 [Candidatus Woesebacteria bacterium RIFCSPHIGHO2_01_FULL_39_95]OGM33894.1 MAG: hypothetical protein A3D01_05735 [Candidatus Woesebacteria bacterium RIFCSPHIGHO2_02_FULL_39_13]OGM37183.1 MAG: hypothetical protein A3E13_03065 [Candidatus Woesebacteria bacterium RIFCSPHIGHO2_12_FULL_40_20]OGM68305.1 MAG: hypothetical protein A2962_05340 [Candidatus Woesebacteria bacterium RIFCSPLOWO2_01_FULL_39_61]OGM74051.1 MAG: hypothetical protein A3H19_02380 [Candidatus